MVLNSGGGGRRGGEGGTIAGGQSTRCVRYSPTL